VVNLVKSFVRLLEKNNVGGGVTRKAPHKRRIHLNRMIHLAQNHLTTTVKCRKQLCSGMCIDHLERELCRTVQAPTIPMTLRTVRKGPHRSGQEGTLALRHVRSRELQVR
jgi:hypothetical protein